MNLATLARGAAALTLGLALSGAALAQKVRLATSMGDIVVELDAAKAPKTVENYVAYVKAGHYDGTVFHRVIPDFMIQGGGMEPSMKEKATRAPIPLESRNGLSNVRGSIAMARTMVPDSSIHTAIGMLTKPNRSSVTCARSKVWLLKWLIRLTSLSRGSSSCLLKSIFPVRMPSKLF